MLDQPIQKCFITVIPASIPHQAPRELFICIISRNVYRGNQDAPLQLVLMRQVACLLGYIFGFRLVYVFALYPYYATANTRFFNPQDMNPLRPCGACNEWLKKVCELTLFLKIIVHYTKSVCSVFTYSIFPSTKQLAESNPYFTILTFTDSACNGVYCTPCEEQF